MKLSNKLKNIISITLIIIALGLIVAGVMNEEVNLVYKKAVNICIECIGIG